MVLEQKQIKGLSESLSGGGGLSMLWAEETGDINPSTNNGYQWSFGNGVENSFGVVIPYAYTIKGMTAICESGTGNGTVEVYINGAATGVTITFSGGQDSRSDLNYQVDAHKRIAFRTITGSGGQRATVSISMATLGVEGPQGEKGERGPAGVDSGYNIKDYGAIGDGDFHTVNEWRVGEPFDRGYAGDDTDALLAIQQDYPWVDSLSYNADQAAWEKAKDVVPSEGGTVDFANGHYRFECKVFRDKLRIRGESRTGVIIDSSEIEGDPPNSKNGIQISIYRRGGWLMGEADVETYQDTLKVGQSWIDVANSTVAATYTPGEAIFINAGSTIYFDQEHGEFNRVKSVYGNRIYLEYNLLNDYDTSVAPHNALLIAPFTPPALNETAVANIAFLAPGPDGFPSADSLISLGNELYKFKSVDDSGGYKNALVTLENVKSTNQTATDIPTGTKVFKQRVIIRTPESYGNIEIENLTVKAQGDVINLSNSIGVEIDRVNFYKMDAGGFWMDGDDGRHAKFRNCKIDSFRLRTAQPARSCADMSFRDCEFHQVTMHFSEFSKNCEVVGNKFYVHSDQYLYDQDWVDAQIAAGESSSPIPDATNNDPSTPDPFKDSAPVGLGWTTSNIKVEHNEFHADGISVVIDAFPDVNGYRAAWRGSHSIKNNKIFANGTEYLIRFGQSGAVEIAHNKMFGSTMAIFGISGIEMPREGDLYPEGAIYPLGAEMPLDGTVELDGKFIGVSYMDVHHNQFSGKLAILNIGEPKNIKFTDNFIHATGDIDIANAGQGNIMFKSTGSANSGRYPNVEMVIFRDNTFKNWRFASKNAANESFRYNNVYNERVDISKNLFLDARDYQSPATRLSDTEFYVDFEELKLPILSVGDYDGAYVGGAFTQSATGTVKSGNITRDITFDIYPEDEGAVGTFDIDQLTVGGTVYTPTGGVFSDVIFNPGDAVSIRFNCSGLLGSYNWTVFLRDNETNLGVAKFKVNATPS